MVEDFHGANCNHSYTVDANHSFGSACNHKNMAINLLFKQVREAANDSPEEAARKAGVSRVAYRKWETGQTTNHKLSNLLSFCDAYKIDVESLMRGRIVPSAGALYQSGRKVCERPREYIADTENLVAQDDSERQILMAWRNRTPDQEAMFRTLVSMSKTEKSSASDQGADRLAS